MPDLDFSSFFGRQGVRDSAPLAALPGDGPTGVHPITTEIVRGIHRGSAEWVRRLFPVVTPDLGADLTPSDTTFYYPVYGGDHLTFTDTALPPGAPYTEVTAELGWASDQMETHGAKVGLRLEERARAHDPAAWVARKMRRPVETIARWREYQAHQIVTDTTVGATYASGHVTAITGGQEWDAGGDMLGQISASVEAVATSVIVTPETDIHIALPRVSYVAATKNAAFQSWMGQALQPINRQDQTGTAARLAEYLGVASVWRFDPVDETGARLFSDVAIVYTHGPMAGSDFVADDGPQSWSVEYQHRGLLGMDEWYDNDVRTWWQPVLESYKLSVIQPGAAAYLTNTAS